MKKVIYSFLLLQFIYSYHYGQDYVQTTDGKISGTSSEDGTIKIYRGIPFAAPPTGDLRWKAPQPTVKWEGIKFCNNFGPSPMQGKPVPFSMWSEEFLIPEKPIDEDCLYLNVWSGAKDQENRPVLVWIYGGGFSSGGSAVPIYDGEAMARKGIIFVSMNYRVGIFGFFCHPTLSAESPSKSSGNYGLLDQIAALRWVQDNIKAFGGDPDNVTIAGQSAGSMSVNCLVASPLAKGLFTRAIAHSGATFTGKQTTLQDAEMTGANAIKENGILSLEQLRQIPADSLMKLQTGIRGPIIDGYVLPNQILQIFHEGKQNPVDLLTGWTQEEGLVFGGIKNATDFKQQLMDRYGDQAEEILQFYLATSDETAKQAQFDLARDIIFGSQNYTWANIQSQSGNRTYVYRFFRKVPGTGIYANYGAFHTGDVPYAYDNLRFIDRPWEKADHQLAETMSGYWANFIKSGNPNGNNLPLWPEYQLNDKRIIILDQKVSAEELPDAKALDLIYKIVTQ